MDSGSEFDTPGGIVYLRNLAKTAPHLITPDGVQALGKELDRCAEVNARVRTVHRKENRTWVRYLLNRGVQVCYDCNVPWPCPTIQFIGEK